MNKLMLPCIAAATAVSIAFAAPADDVSAAAKKLADAANYSWTTTIANADGGGGGGGFGGGPSSGKTVKGGVTITTRTGPNGETQNIRQGDKMVMQNQEGAWVTQEELMAQFGGGQGGAPGGGGRGGGRGGFGFGGAGAVNPAEDVMALVGQAKDFKAADGAIVGTLTPEGVAPRLGGRGGRRGGEAPPPPTNASGSVKFWLKDGVVAKYEIHVKGTVQGRGGEMQVDRTTTTEIKDVGTTKVDIPAAAKAKLGS
jgi:hypothetical protein